MRKKKTVPELADECIRAWNEVGEDTDVLGSYTGIFRASAMSGSPVYAPYDRAFEDYDTQPVQDADDL